MKIASFAASVAACVVLAAANANANANANADADANVNANIAHVPTPQEALEAAQKITPPAGIVLTGATEPIEKPSNFDAVVKTETADGATDTTTMSDGKGESESGEEKEKEKEALQEFWGGLGWGGLGGWGGWDGWGGFGPYRFGYSCGGLGGWAYPLGYWNAFGAGLWGGGCGLGLAYGGLFYC